MCIRDRCTLAPALVQGREVSVAFGKTASHSDFEAVTFVADEVDRHANRKAAAHRRVERHENTLCGVRKVCRTHDDAVDERLAVLGFTGLNIGCVDTGLNEVAFSMDAEQASPFSLDLPAENERCVAADTARLAARSIAPRV